MAMLGQVVVAYTLVVVGFQMSSADGDILLYDVPASRSGNMHWCLPDNFWLDAFLHTLHISVLRPLAVAGLLVSRKMG